ncbi:hypothetical protein [Brasilonema sp. UFV-L1]|uniref:hypothetical protein n=1 Tax=Brasilonema sp. UFV-L1 TaxID=2234130 RepID=UPI00145E746B|nr:hypothetical protein [Brasilonema sp. UFV-L1]NMG11892.1 hypothetical protein [Brasilonema sp. UFV-L1]
MSSTAEIILIARDLTGAVFRGVQSNILGLNQAASTVNGNFNRMGTAVGTMAGYAGNAMAGLNVEMLALNAAIGVVTRGVDSLNNAFRDGVERQGEILNSEITATKTLGLSYDQAAKYVQKFNEQVGILGRDLPTSAEAIASVSRTIQDDFALALRSVGRTPDEVSKSLLEASSKIALLGELSNTTVKDTRAAISGYISGSVGPGGLDRYKFFADNTLLRNALIENLRAINPNARSFGTISLGERVDILVKALNSSISDQDIDKLKGLSKSKLSQFFDTLFDPTTGLLSFQRDLEPNIDGYQSVFTSFTETIDLVLGEGGLFWEVARVLGFSGDIMKSVKGFVDDFNNILRGLISNVEGINTGDTAALGTAFGKFVADVITFVLGKLIGIIFANAGNYFGFIGGFARSLVINLVKNILGLAFKVVGMVPGMIVSAIFSPLGKIIAALARPIIDAAKSVFSFFGSFFEIIKNAISNAIGTVINTIRSLIDAVVKPIKSFIGSVGSVGANVLGGAGSIVSGAASGVGGFFSSVASGIGGFFSSLLPKYQGNIPTAANGYFGALETERRNAPRGANLVVANDSEYILTPRQMGNLVNGLTNGGKTVNITFGAGSIVLNLPSGTAEEVALKAIAIIEQTLRNELEARLA